MRDKAFDIAENPKCGGYQRGLALVVYNCFDKNISEYRALSETLATQNIFAGTSIKNENISKQRIS